MTRLVLVIAAVLAAMIGAAAPAALTPRMAAQPIATHTPTPEPQPFPGSPGPSATPVDTSTDEALDILRRSDAAMNLLRSATMRWTMRSRTGRDVPFEELAARYSAPDRRASVYRYSNHPPLENVYIGRDRWSRAGDGAWKHETLRLPFAWPRFGRCAREGVEGFGGFGPVQQVRVLREEELKGATTWVLAYEQRVVSIEGPFDVFTTEWIDQASYRLLASEVYDSDPWGSPELQVTRFGDFDAPMAIDPPAGWPTPAAIAPVVLPWILRAP